MAVRLLLPAACFGCGAELGAGRHRLGLCAGCRLLLPAPGGPICAGCGRSLPAGEGVPPARVDAGLCAGCRQRPPPWRRLVVPWLYRPPLDAVLRGLKFGRLDYLGDHLAEALFVELGCGDSRSSEGVAATLREVDAVVPVPLHWRRRLARGYNQAERIAEPLARRLARPLLPTLVRRRATAAQSGLPRARRLANLRRAFRVRRPGMVAGRRVLLVDDVVTTGATLASAARELRRGGAAEVIVLAVARTPDE